MRVHRGLEGLELRPRALALGVFDGVHRGHRRILEALVAARREGGLESALLMTFHPHPLAVLRPDRAPRLISTLDERLEELSRHGADELLLMHFDARFASTPFDVFARDTLVGRLGMRQLVAGYDFRMGRGRGGSAEDMASLGERLDFRVEVVTPCYLDGEIISSTRIRAAVEDADLDAARARLGRPFRLGGRVVEGERRGRELGFPTANLEPFPPEKLLPPPGVYRVRVSWKGRSAPGLMNLGRAPTLRDRFLAEVHLLDFSGDLYGEHLKVDVLQRFRPERKFSGAAELRQAIAGDVARLRRKLENEDRENL